MKLRVYRNGDLIQELDLVSGESYMGGRKERCQIQLEKYPGISREHFEIDEDGSGAWRVNVLSEIKLVEFDGEERKDFLLKDDESFRLDPYQFEFSGNAAVADDENQFNVMAENSLDAQSNKLEKVEAFQDTPDIEEGDGDEKTAIQSFSGLPYIKIIGQNGKKSEYFRLEGNLWVVGGHEGASVFLREPSAAQNHFEISKTDKGFFLVDLGSQQGTELNGQQLTAKKPTRLLSGDIITVGATSLQFELRDKAFKRKVNNIPLNMYKNPLVFFDQDVAMVSLDEEESGPGNAEEIYEKTLEAQQKKKKTLMIAAAVLFLGFAIAKDFIMPPKEEKKVMTADPFGQLSPAEQKIVRQTYKLASQLYLSKNYELSIVQLDKLHTIIPVYKDSKKMEEDCINARDIQRQKALREQQIREQEELERRVNSLIAQCEKQYSRSEDIDGAKACLVPAADLDPNNPRIAQLVTEVTARSEERKIREKMAAEAAEKVRRGKELYQKAVALHKKQRWHDAIEAYENHIHSGLPDPKRLVKQSKRKLASIEYQIKTKKNALLGSARNKYSGTQLKEAIVLARKAQRVDPFDPSISAFLYKIEKELKSKVKAIYMDSVIEERFGNIEASRVKWEEIMKADVEDGEYYIKAKRKLKLYGYKH